MSSCTICTICITDEVSYPCKKCNGSVCDPCYGKLSACPFCRYYYLKPLDVQRVFNDLISHLYGGDMVAMNELLASYSQNEVMATALTEKLDEYEEQCVAIFNKLISHRDNGDIVAWYKLVAIQTESMTIALLEKFDEYESV